MVYQFNNMWMKTLQDFIDTETEFMKRNNVKNHFYLKLFKSKDSKKYYVQLIFHDQSNNTITMNSLPLYPKQKAVKYAETLLQNNKLIKEI